MDKYKIGVFDSGKGGKSVANAIEKALPDAEVIFVNDPEHVPYGKRQPEEILGFVKPILQGLVDQKCDAIVIACNTVTTTLAPKLREIFDVPFVCIEPMVKPAAENTKSKVIAVCATPTTLASKRYEWLKKEFASGVKVIEPDCSNWTDMIETDKVDYDFIASEINNAINDGADIIVLACTHYHWIEEEVKKIASGRAQVIQPEQATIRQLKKVLNID